MKYPINEMFNSIQGEGKMVGVNALFVRFAGCNRKCHFCDTNHDEAKVGLLEKDELVALIAQEAESKDIILTGGEPMMYVDLVLLEALSNAGFFIHIETNGDYPISDEFMKYFYSISIAPKSTKTLMKFVTGTSSLQRKYIKFSIKLLVPFFTESAITNAIDIIDGAFAGTIYIMSVNGLDDINQVNNKNALNMVKKLSAVYPSNDIRYGVQLHKILGVK